MVIRERIAENGLEAQGFDDAGIDMSAEMEGSGVRSQRAAVLDPVAAVVAVHTNVIDPRDSELYESLRFHQLLGEEGVLGVPIEDWGEALHGAGHGIDVFDLVGIAAFGFSDQQFGGFLSRFEAHVALSTKEGFVAPGFGGVRHGLMDSLFFRDEITWGFGCYKGGRGFGGEGSEG